MERKAKKLAVLEVPVYQQGKITPQSCEVISEMMQHIYVKFCGFPDNSRRMTMIQSVKRFSGEVSLYFFVFQR
jgi:hypothetical protein